MIINRPGATFEYGGVTYTIGAPIVGTAQSEYEGLYGSITEIRDGDDKDTENGTPDLYCEFEPPVLPCEIKKLEAVFSDLYDMPKTIDDIILDMVIMAPEMVCPLDDLSTMREQTQVYLVLEDWAVDGEHGNSCELLTDHDDAKRVLVQKLHEEFDNGAIPRWADYDHFVQDSTEDSYEGYIDGEYMENHYSISIIKQPLTMSSQYIRKIGGLAAELTPRQEPLLSFIEEEVPFRLREIFGWIPNSIITDEVIDACVSALWNDTNVMFAYDTMDDVITRELKNLGITEDSVNKLDEVKKDEH